MHSRTLYVTLFWTTACVPCCTCFRILVLWVLVLSPCVLFCVSQCFPLYLRSGFSSIPVFSPSVSPALPVCYLGHSFAILARSVQNTFPVLFSFAYSRSQGLRFQDGGWARFSAPSHDLESRLDPGNELKTFKT